MNTDTSEARVNLPRSFQAKIWSQKLLALFLNLSAGTPAPPRFERRRRRPPVPPVSL